MKVTYNWLKDFVEIKISPKTLAEKLTMAGLEVTSLEECEGDFVFEIEVTSNRPDCLSVIGIAREVAAITKSKVKSLSAIRYPLSAKNSYSLSIRIEDKKDCPLYTAKIIKDVKVGPSPDWLKKRLELIGCRSVNNIVDITNYILFEWGQPLHTFDLDKLNGNAILVRRAKDNEKLITIDGQERMLNSHTLVIADEKRPVAMAGIMGGRDTEVAEATKNILLEAAVFNPIIVRRVKRNLGLQSDSSYRFERGVNPETVDGASGQAVKLIQVHAGGSCVLAQSSGAVRIKRKDINLKLSTVHKILGADIRSVEVKTILTRLEFKVKTKAKDNLVVKVPSHRQDVSLEIDLIEEISRIWGYECIRSTVPAVLPQITAADKRECVSLIKDILVGLGLNEVITYSLVDKVLLQAFPSEKNRDVIEISNPLSKEQGVLRPALIPSLVDCVAYNLNQKQEQDSVNIFEVAKIFSGGSSQPKEELALGIALCGIKSLLLEQGAIKDKLGALHLKGILETLFERIGIKDYSFTVINSSETGVYAGREAVGSIIKLPQDIKDKLDIKNKEVVAAQILLDKILPLVNLQKRFTGIALYPGISRDISMVLKEDILVGQILKAIKENASPLLKEAGVIDYYKGKQIPAGFKGLTVSCFYRSDERTLTEAEISPIHSLVSGMLVERFHAQIR